jgi:hypothetical protein
VQMTVEDLRKILMDYDDQDVVLFVEHQYRGPGIIFRADRHGPLELQKNYSYKPGLTEPEHYVVFNLTTLAMTNDYVPAQGESISWPGREQ